MNIIICDDIKAEAEKISEIIKTLPYNVNTFVCDNAFDVIDRIQSGTVTDACFLDIVMPGINGIKLAEDLRKIGYSGHIIFMTASNDYAAESYNVKAFSYLLKPPDFNQINEVLKALIETKNKNDTEGILVKFSKVAKFLLFKDISYIEVINHTIHFYIKTGEELQIYSALKDISSSLLSDRRFVQCHRSFIVNMYEIASINDWLIVMRDGKKVPVSKSYPETKKKFTKFILGSNNG